ncbi:MAG: GH32 C-terminal domain-containing protein [Planctomycetota bacterium]|jgi:sucrose-6-phosphate hydrolase SacC (GH32 family)
MPWCFGQAGFLKMTGGRIKLHLLVDPTSLELFGNDGLLSMSSCTLHEDDSKSLGLLCRGGQVRFCKLRLWELKSIRND